MRLAVLRTEPRPILNDAFRVFADVKQAPPTLAECDEAIAVYDGITHGAEVSTGLKNDSDESGRSLGVDSMPRMILAAETDRSSRDEW